MSFWILDALIIIWLAFLSFLVLQNKRFLQKLFPNREDDFETQLQEVFKAFDELSSFKKKSLGYIQTAIVKRYNPYKDTGGDQSFSVAFLDGKGDGLILTSLHSRSGTRIFAKPVKEGKENGFPFSEEEKEVVKLSMRK